MACAVVIVARKLRPYLKLTPLRSTDRPLRSALHNPETPGRLIHWLVKLGEFDIKYQPRTAIKGQVLADFVADYTYPNPELPDEEEQKPWLLLVAINHQGS